jgi:hypothetical protein
MELDPRPPELPRSMALGKSSSRASLEQVKHVEICIELCQPQKCIGMLFTYQDGSAEALGQRRVGFPGVQMLLVDEPLQIHFCSWRDPGFAYSANLGIRFSTLKEQDKSSDPKRGWQTRDMKGSLWWVLDGEYDRLKFCDDCN